MSQTRGSSIWGLTLADGSEAGQAQYVKLNTLVNVVNEWIEDVNVLAKIAKTEPQCAYSTYVYGMSKRWAFICRTTPDVNQQMRRLGHHITLTLIPAIVGKDHITDQMRHIFSMPAKYGGLGILDPDSVCSLEYESSIKATCQLTNTIFSQQLNKISVNKILILAVSINSYYIVLII